MEPGGSKFVLGEKWTARICPTGKHAFEWVRGEISACDCPSEFHGTVTVTGVDREAGVITVSMAEKP